MAVAVCSVPVLLLGTPICQYVSFRRRQSVRVSLRLTCICSRVISFSDRHPGSFKYQSGDRTPLVTDDGNINTRQEEVEEGAADEEVKMKFRGRLFFFSRLN